MAKISLIILTYNEELNLEKCLKSVDGLVSEIIIIDSGSTDKTKEIAEKYSAKFVVHEFKNQADQFNWTLDNVEISGDWVMRLDADEELLPELKKEIEEKLPKLSNEINGVVLRRRVYFMGRWIRHGGYYPTCLMRIFRKGTGMSENREMDEHLVLKSGEEVVFENDFIDDNKKDLTFWIAKHNGYASREARATLQKHKDSLEGSFSGSQAEKKRWLKEKIYNNFPLFVRPFFYYIYRYIFRLGFLDGKEGFIFHFLQAFWYRFLVDAKILELKRKKNG
jgi:glycosyltransferase involved in cell wall biosynthesis